MFLYFIEISKSFVLILLLNDYFKRMYPKRYNNFMIDIIFNVIYTYSYCEIWYKNSIKHIKYNYPYVIETINYLDYILKTKEKILNIEFIKDNVLTYAKSKNYYLNTKDVEVIPEHDFIIYTDIESIPKNIKIINSKNKIINLSDAETYKCEKSNIKFMLLEFIVENINISINLLTEEYNFYVKGNILDINFFLYYLRNIHPNKIELKKEHLEKNEFTIHIIDQDVNISKFVITKENNKCIYIDTFNYQIIDK
jgi:hypothetical protein